MPDPVEMPPARKRAAPDILAPSQPIRVEGTHPDPKDARDSRHPQNTHTHTQDGADSEECTNGLPGFQTR